jgi:hypothetical protein
MNDTTPLFRELGVEPSTGRRILLLPFETLDQVPIAVGTAGPRFVLLLLGDFSKSLQSLGELARQLVDAGCSYLCVWGPGCELMHNEMDEAREKAPQLEDDDISVLMTTSHADDSIEDAVAFAAARASPVGMYEVGCNATILAVHNHGNWPRDVEKAARQWIR